VYEPIRVRSITTIITTRVTTSTAVAGAIATAVGHDERNVSGA
jgi:hypothetical protein